MKSKWIFKRQISVEQMGELLEKTSLRWESIERERSDNR